MNYFPKSVALRKAALPMNVSRARRAYREHREIWAREAPSNEAMAWAGAMVARTARTQGPAAALAAALLLATAGCASAGADARLGDASTESASWADDDNGAEERETDAVEGLPSLDDTSELATLGTAADRIVREELLRRVQGHDSLGYKQARRVLLGGLDRHNGRLECIYTGVPARHSNANIEHSWPQSWGANAEPARSDLHHLFVSTIDANSARGNVPFGETRCDETGRCRWSEGRSCLGPRIGDGAEIFEVRPERRGDIARAQFYFAIRYQKSIDDRIEPTLRAWSAADPPDEDECVRNDAIHELQHNRNPFIDEPGLENRLSNF